MNATTETKRVRMSKIENAERVYSGGGFMFRPVAVGQLIEEFAFLDTSYKGGCDQPHRFRIATEQRDRLGDWWNNRSTQTVAWWTVSAVPPSHSVEQDPEPGESVYGPFVDAVYESDALELVPA